MHGKTLLLKKQAIELDDLDYESMVMVSSLIRFLGPCGILVSTV